MRVQTHHHTCTHQLGHRSLQLLCQRRHCALAVCKLTLQSSACLTQLCSLCLAACQLFLQLSTLALQACALTAQGLHLTASLAQLLLQLRTLLQTVEENRRTIRGRER